MSRRAGHYHFLTRTEMRNVQIAGGVTRGEDAVYGDVEYGVTTCGVDGQLAWKWMRFVTDETKVTCPTCASKLAKQKLRALGGTLTMEQDKTARGFFRHQGGWRALVNGVQVGWLGYEDHAWRVYKLALGRRDETDKTQEETLLVSMALDNDGTEGHRYSMSGLRAARFKSKEDALLKAGEWREAGLLKTEADIRNDRVHAREVWRAQQDRRERKHAQKEEARLAVLEGLNEILTEHPLSNLQRDAVVTAIERFTPPIPLYSIDDEDG